MSKAVKQAFSPVTGLHSGLSLTGRSWVWRSEPDDRTERLALALAQKKNLSDFLAGLMTRRGVTPETADLFLDPTLRTLMPDPFSLKDMDKAAERLVSAIRAGETVGIFGDYDVDGACSAALLAGFLQRSGCRVLTHIPDRLTEGYGPNPIAMDALAEQGAGLIVCVDCGTSAADIFARMEHAPDIVVIDHHVTEGPPPPVHATVNPQRGDCESGLRTLCAAALTWLVMAATMKLMENDRRPLLDDLDLVALATVCDVMPLTGTNRAFVTQGLKIMGQRRRTGLRSLMDAAGVNGQPTAFSCGYALGPRVNAGGRIGDAGLGAKMLLSSDEEETGTIARQLTSLNRTRQEVEQDTLSEALKAAEAQIAAGHAVVLTASAAWHPGIVGIIAGRIKEKFNRPALVAATDENGILKGSGRSIPGCDIGRAVIAAREYGILLTGGGHMMAAGFGLEQDRLSEFHAFMNERLAAACEAPAAPPLMIDAVLPLSAATEACTRDMAAMEPFGAGNEEPVLILQNVRVVRYDRIGKDGNTIRVILGDQGTGTLKALMFRVQDSPALPVLEDRQRPLLHVAGCLRMESWNGRESLSFFISDVALAGS
ncbi:single-stranded-DNA-specific exonuclease RecJ [Acetobacter sp. AN02]|uniref:single-stranded-DNA-specific exonuclease RecJ n=1 Tax=Acetobacter sp. AN02 TaxID=2894186 RepID=UPI00243452CF|nr:single-stranded-DNA-specific exonuclease RecJ [Acetobacter sp. AN02]MDG6095227.1 single-stranded-DNA-specific exonuclease RecJ [Acetobacter sp. AN02]